MIYDRVWEGPRTKVGKLNPTHDLVQIGWWYEPEAQFVPITQEQPSITGSATPAYVEVGD